ncbi:MAG: MoxR family ATPase [Acidimicrobiales bacterium]|nr:MoxR family ATPase [Acidimicrobiales bacterium]
MTEATAEQVQWFADQFRVLQSNVEQFIRGKTSVVQMALVALLSEGHLLIDDIPGVGKTSLAKAIANSIEGTMSRVQFTPDLLPSDLTGTQIWNMNTRNFEFRAGPVFANIVVGDEINRASPKTQSAMLEVMEERQVSVEGNPVMVPRPFMVIATQNPVEFDGTYHLPEAQIDRFMMKLSIGYPDHESEIEIIRGRSSGITVEQLRPVSTLALVANLIEIARGVHVAPAWHSYIVSLCSSTRQMGELRLGVSPRGSLALLTAAQTQAASRGRTFVTADDVKQLLPYVLGHRMLLTAEAELQGHTATTLLNHIAAAIPTPEIRLGV